MVHLDVELALTEQTILARRWRLRKIRRLRLKLLAQYRRRGEIIASLDLDSLPAEIVGDLLACRRLYERWEHFVVAERWHHRSGGVTPDNPIDALRLIGLWETPQSVH
jgi:hypothetical protein